MNEETQAELLAAWLDGGGPPPEGLDPDVVESAIALRPELAAPPSVTADEILASLTAGPLAGPPPNASLTEAPETPEPSNTRWFYGLLGAGGLSTLALAAVGLLVFGTFAERSVSHEAPPASVAAAPARQQILPEAEAVEEDAVALVDTGSPKGGAPVAQKPRMEARKQRVSSAPRPAPRPARAAAPADGVALLEAEEADLDDDAFVERSRVLADEPTPAMEKKEIPELDAEGGGGFGMVGGQAASRGAAPPPPPGALADEFASEAPAAPSRSRAAREEAMAAPAIAEAEPSEPGADLDALAGRAHRNTGRADHPQLTAAREALQAGDPGRAIQACETGLSALSGDTVERQLLYALLGDARLRLGDRTGARAAWEEADRIRRAR